MYPADTGIHGYFAVQLLFLLHVGLALGATLLLTWLGMSFDLALPVLIAVGLVFVKPFGPLYRDFYPTHDDS